MLKIGLLGVGHLGKIHLKCIQMVKELELVGFYDPDDENSKRAIEQHGVRRFHNMKEFLKAVDVVDIVTPTTTHFQLAKKALLAGKHVFIEKPVTHTIAEAEELLDISREFGLKVQVGHVERFNPAFLALKDKTVEPMYIEANRLATFNPRGTDVSVVLDLMIHDLDIILKLVPYPVVKVDASGLTIVSETHDLTNVRIEFENGCVANLTTSRMSMKNERMLRLYQENTYASIDFLNKNAEIIRLFEEDDPHLPLNAQFIELDTRNGKKLMHIEIPPIEQTNAIKMELETFAHAIINDETPYVTLEDGYEALKLAYRIIENVTMKNEGVMA